MRYVCATHEPLDYPLRPFMHPISTVPVGDGVQDLSERYPHLRGRGQDLGEYGTYFALRRLLQESWEEEGPPPDDEMIATSHYRRFPVVRPTGQPVSVYGAVSREEFLGLPDDLFLPPPGTLVIPRTVDYGLPVVTDYGVAHHARDILRFMGVAVDLGVVGDAEVGDFLGNNVAITTPTVAVVPVTWLVEVLESLERVVQAFEASYAPHREGYQRRAAAFSCERLHALLLAGFAARWPQDRLLATPVLLVSDDPVYTPGA